MFSMEMENMKCVMVIDEALPLGFIANTAGILGFTLGKELPGLVGPDVTDGSQQKHMGIIEVPIPILRSSQENIKKLRNTLYHEEFEDLITVDFSDVAQSCQVYSQFAAKMAMTEESRIHYFGIGICGSKKKVNKLTGSMPLLR